VDWVKKIVSEMNDVPLWRKNIRRDTVCETNKILLIRSIPSKTAEIRGLIASMFHTLRVMVIYGKRITPGDHR
jgi:hypothetical protein